MPEWNTNRGVVDVYTNSSNHALDAQEAFKTSFDAFEHWVSLGYCNRVALFWGEDGGGAGTGTDFHDGGSPFKSNAWYVYQFPPTLNRKYSFYVHGQYSEDGTYGNGPSSAGAPALIENNRGTVAANTGQFGFQAAIGITSVGLDGNPWAGTSNFDGADTKGTVAGVGPVWAAPGGGTVHVFPRSNNTGGTHVTNKENMMRVYNANGGYYVKRHDYVSDGDSFHMRSDPFDTGQLQSYFYFGPYRLRRDLGGDDPCPFVAIHSDQSLANPSGLAVNTYGGLSGTAFNTGGILWDPSVGVQDFAVLSWGAGTTYTNNDAVSHTLGSEVGANIFPAVFSAEETGNIGIVGQSFSEKWGYIDSNVLSQDDVHPSTPPYSLRQWQWSTGTEPWEWVFQYAGSGLPKSSSTRAGRVI
jgi:hypothetical protein